MLSFLGSSAYVLYAALDRKKKNFEDDSFGTVLPGANNSMIVQPQSLFDDEFKKLEKANDKINMGIWIAISVYALNWLDVIFLSKPDTSHRYAINNNRDIYLSLNLGRSPNSNNERLINIGAGVRF